MLAFYVSFTKMVKQIYKEFPYGLTLNQMMLLSEIAGREDLTMQKAAELLVMDITTFSRQASSLEKKGMLERTPAELDRRFYFLTLTEQGKKAVEAMNVLFSSHFDDFFEGMNAFEKETIMRSITALSMKMDSKIE